MPRETAEVKMDTFILDPIPFEPNCDDLAKTLRVRPGRSSESELKQMLAKRFAN